MNMYLPLLLVVLSNTVYHICTKSTPAEINTFAALSVTYATGAVFCLLLYFFTQRNGNLLAEYRQLNWSSFLLGICIVGLEAGFLLMYKAGWNVSTGQTMSSAFLAIVLVIVGYLLYQEAITVQKVTGVGICLVGLYLLNK